MSHGGSSLSDARFVYVPGTESSVFPRYSAQVAKESVAVIASVLVTAAFATAAVLVAGEAFARPAERAACSTLEVWSQLGPWCAAAI